MTWLTGLTGWQLFVAWSLIDIQVGLGLARTDRGAFFEVANGLTALVGLFIWGVWFVCAAWPVLS